MKSLKLDNVEITWLGHAGFKIKNPSFVIYIDPFKVEKGDRADLILVTHAHFDHKDQKSIEALSDTDTKVLLGTEDILEGEEKEVNGIKIKAMPAYNIDKSYHARGIGVGFIVTIDGKKIYHAGDTDALPSMSGLDKIDVLILPIGGKYTVNVDEAVNIVKTIKPKFVIPMHFGTFEDIGADPEEFRQKARTYAEVKILEK